MCESCGEPIGKARLQAFPRAVLCVTLQAARGTTLTSDGQPAADAEAPRGRKLPVVIGVAVFDRAGPRHRVQDRRGGTRCPPAAGPAAWAACSRCRCCRNPGAAFSIGTSMTIVFTRHRRGRDHLHPAGSPASCAACPGPSRWACCWAGPPATCPTGIFRSPGLFRGYVVDWIELPHWPVFNLADSAIVCGGVMAVLLAVHRPAHGRHPGRPPRPRMPCRGRL